MGMIINPYRFGSRYSTLSTEFNGVDQDVRFPNGAFSALTGGSISLWIRHGLESPNECIFAASILTGSNDFFVLATLDTGSILIQMRTSGTNRYLGTIAAGSIIANTWHHLLYTKTGTTHKIYIDGVDKPITFTVSSSLASFFSNISGTVAYTMGNFRRNSNANYFSGYMDEVSIFSDVKAYSDFHSGGKPKDLTGLTNMRAWPRMGEGSTYPTINDESGNGNDLTMVNMSSANFVSVVP